jgi:hypothetical protein
MNPDAHARAIRSQTRFASFPAMYRDETRPALQRALVSFYSCYLLPPRPTWSNSYIWIGCGVPNCVDAQQSMPSWDIRVHPDPDPKKGGSTPSIGLERLLLVGRKCIATRFIGLTWPQLLPLIPEPRIARKSRPSAALHWLSSSRFATSYTDASQ